MCYGKSLINSTTKNRSQKWAAPVLEAPEGRRDDFVEPYFRHAKQDQVVSCAAKESASSCSRWGLRQRKKALVVSPAGFLVEFLDLVVDRPVDDVTEELTDPVYRRHAK
ncbi:MAG: hypothetical protein DMG89_16530 [Acidobacteria bacterium]|nr:MAG: hypothetical protein DMG89_16530 [Acidobacteriota bacterium]